MLRALWTAGQGMIAQQLNVDVISNNLSNVNTTGFKKDRLEFKDMLYETFSRAYSLEGEGRPVNLQVGHGVTASATVKNYRTGNLQKTERALDFAIQGEGFFKVQLPSGEIAFTRDGSFKVSISQEGSTLTTSEGFFILDTEDEFIVLPNNVGVNDIVVSTKGDLSYISPEGAETIPLDQKLDLVTFQNRYGLESIGNNFYRQTVASGEPLTDSPQIENSMIIQNFIESSNVQIVEEMVDLIVAQRAYEINSKSIQTADEMLSTANNLKR
jgi:flagellar basal-body rod protein FlgG